MILFIFLTIVAGIVQAGVIYALKVGFLKSLIFAAPFILLHQYIFIYNYLHAPNFIVMWFLTAAITAALSFLVGYFFFNDTLSIYQVIGIIFIIAGMVFMKF